MQDAQSLRERLFEPLGGIMYVAGQFFRNLLTSKPRIGEWLRQCYAIGYQSAGLVALTGFIMGLVLTYQSRPTLSEFGAVSMLPSMISVSVIREIGPVITALICAGKISSRIGAELASMRVTEQIDAMEVSGAIPMNFLVVPRVVATTLMIPILVVYSDIFALVGAFVANNIADSVSWNMFMFKSFQYLDFYDVFPSLIKTYVFGFFIGVIGSYFGYFANQGTESVGKAANSGVVMASIAIFIVDMIVVQITSLMQF
jgi:phospholipid/cholesterol/gamma-HCH transport system permease protein